MLKRQSAQTTEQKGVLVTWLFCNIQLAKSAIRNCLLGGYSQLYKFNDAYMRFKLVVSETFITTFKRYHELTEKEEIVIMHPSSRISGKIPQLT